MSLYHLLMFVALAGVVHANNNELQLAPVSCNARYSAPCARTNSQWLAMDVAARLSSNTADLLSEFDRISNKVYNRDTGFYPFVVSSESAVCAAHGGNKAFVGKTIAEIFEEVGITYADADAVHERFRNANGDWVQYLWSDGGRVNSKLAFVVNVTDSHYLGVGYENEPLPQDTPCSDDYDSWCSLTNVRRLVGQAQFSLNQAESLESFENTLFRISFDDQYKVPGGFYLFMYHFDGELKAHGVLRDSFGKSLSEILPEKQLGSAQDGINLHQQFTSAVENQNGAWVQYQWRNSLPEDPITKVAFLAKISFGADDYYLGSGFNFAVNENLLTASLGEPCSDKYNLPCSFRTAHQLSSHALSHAIASPLPVRDRFQAISRDDSFKQDGFYIFAYSFDNVCVAHGGNERFVGMSLNEVFRDVGIDLDATQLHQQFRQAAEQGGGWVLYDWVNPGETELFKKISYIFQIIVGGQGYYGGIGFNHQRAPVQVYMERGQREDGSPIPCSQNYGLKCSEVNARAILGQALAELTLSSSEASTVQSIGSTKGQIEDVFAAITAKDNQFTVNDFAVSVFSFGDNSQCETNDATGCAVAHGSNPAYEGLTWNEILQLEEIYSIQGIVLHQQLIDQSNSGGGVVVYPFKGSSKRAVTARFRHEGESYYVVAEYLTDEVPYTCDACPKDTECTRGDQEFCEPMPGIPIQKHPVFLAIVTSIALGIPLAVGIFCKQKRSSAKELAARDEEVRRMAALLEQQMQGMFEVVTDMPIRTAEEYKRKVGADALDKSERNRVSRWYWYEDESRVDQHVAEMVLDGTNYVAYSGEICGQIEHAYKLYLEGRGHTVFHLDLTDKITSTKTGQKLVNISSGNLYEINFEKMEQRNLGTKYPRSVVREEIKLNMSPGYHDLPLLPDGIDFTGDDKEALLPTYTGQIIQVSKVHSGNEWLFGSVLYDPLLDDAMQQPLSNSNEGLNTVVAHALHDRPTSGWFPRCVTKTADATQMRKLLKNLGGEGSDVLAIPENWDESREGRIEVPEGTQEYDAVKQFFLTALHGQRNATKVVSIHRIQNIPLWQSYSVKKQTMRTRYSNDASHRVNNKGVSLNELERRWLFHGTRSDTMPKIENQGFNRSFAGHNDVVYGRGAYFARDASYSTHPIYSAPDSDGVQHMFMCCVAVGDWCKGKHDQITPDAKPYNCFELFDATVDNVNNPSIFVIYHDSQAYPEYLVSFKQKRRSVK